MFFLSDSYLLEFTGFVLHIMRGNEELASESLPGTHGDVFHQKLRSEIAIRDPEKCRTSHLE